MRSIGRTDEVVNDVLSDPGLFPILFNAMFDGDPLIRMRAADGVEKVTGQHPEWLIPFKERTIRELAGIDQQEVRWHTAQILARLVLNPEERREVFRILLGYTQEKSSIVRTFAMQALVDITKQDAELRPQVLSLMESLIYEGTPAMKARGLELLENMKREESEKHERPT
jgi:hypothetical protein